MSHLYNSIYQNVEVCLLFFHCVVFGHPKRAGKVDNQYSLYTELQRAFIIFSFQAMSDELKELAAMLHDTCQAQSGVSDGRF